MEGETIVKEPLCSICGQPIAPDELSADHVPPKQFYPKATRKECTKLWVVPTHKQCNQDYRKDEEYFYHAAYPLVRHTNMRMGQLIHQDLMRRTHKSQTPAMVRMILKEVKTKTEGGLILPPGLAQLTLDQGRLERVAVKIAQGLFYLDQERFLPRENCKDIHLCLSDTEAPELYRMSWECSLNKSVLPDIFSYRAFQLDSLHLVSMLFWQAVMFCAAFEIPQ